MDFAHYQAWKRHQSNYALMKQNFLSVASPSITSALIQDMKNHFKSVINSERAMDSIQDLSELLRILENRLYITFTDTRPLVEIATKFVKDPKLTRIIEDYTCYIEKNPPLPNIDLNLYKYHDGEYSETQLNNNLTCQLEEGDDKEDPIHEPAELPPICLDQSPSNAPLLSHSRSKANSSITRPDGLLNSVHSHFHYLKELKNSNLKRFALFILAMMVLLFVSLFAIIAIYVTSSVPSERQDQIQSNFAVPMGGDNVTDPIHSPLQVQTSVSNNIALTSIQKRVVDEVSANIGKQWRELGRTLTLTEAVIDRIDQDNNDLSAKAYKVLEIFISIWKGPTTWNITLERTLRLIRRTDLAERVNDLTQFSY